MEGISLFDINGDVGRGALGNTAFRDVTSLLSHMEYERKSIWRNRLQRLDRFGYEISGYHVSLY